MIAAKELIELNNKKRTELTPENEKYYSDFLLYIRLHLSLSEQQSEEVLMEILEHILEGQRDGKSARIIFSDNPKAYANEIIDQLPKEKKKNAATFVSSLALNLLGYFLILRGIIFFILPYFKDVNTRVYPITFATLILIIFCFSLLGVGVIFSIIKSSMFKEKESSVKDSIKAGTAGMLSMGMIISATYFLPDIGPSYTFTWYASLTSGAIIIGISYLLKKLEVRPS